MTRAIEQTSNECPLAAALADRLRASKRDLVLHWLERISERVSLSPQRVFPTSDLLDHVPLLIDGIADYLENPADEIGTDMPVVGKAMELGELRHSQGFDAYQILKEYEILGGILFSYLAHAADQMPEPCEKSELLVCGHRLFRAIAIIQQTTTTHYLRLADERVAEREERLRAFNRAMSHEIKNHVGAILGACDLLGTIDPSPAQREEFQQIIMRRARDMKATVDNLVELARLESDPRHHRNVRLPEAAKEAYRQVRETAQAARIKVHISPDIPEVEVNAAVVELCLTNYLSNAIKYARPGVEQVVEVGGFIDSANQRLVIRVRDNGLGVPADKRDRLFTRFFRAHETVTPAEGTGLGLSIVRDTVESIGGRAWAEFPESGSIFLFSLPYRRANAERRQAVAENRASV
jgi:signal transduction histidine kinase